jgi:hypothetical protein
MECEDWNRRYAAKEFIWTVNANRFLVDEAASLLPGRALRLRPPPGVRARFLRHPNVYSATARRGRTRRLWRKMMTVSNAIAGSANQ